MWVPYSDAHGLVSQWPWFRRGRTCAGTAMVEGSGPGLMVGGCASDQWWPVFGQDDDELPAAVFYPCQANAFFVVQCCGHRATSLDDLVQLCVVLSQASGAAADPQSDWRALLEGTDQFVAYLPRGCGHNHIVQPFLSRRLGRRLSVTDLANGARRGFGRVEEMPIDRDLFPGDAAQRLIRVDRMLDIGCTWASAGREPGWLACGGERPSASCSRSHSEQCRSNSKGIV